MFYIRPSATATVPDSVNLQADFMDDLAGPLPSDSVVVTLVNAPSYVTIAATEPETLESSGQPAKLTVSRTGNLDAPLTVLYEVDGTATPDEDYDTLSGSVTFEMGEDEKEIDVMPTDDNFDEGDETVGVTLIANPNEEYEVGGAGSDGVTILDDPGDGLPVVTIAATIPDAFEDGPVPGEFTITRTGDLTNSLTVYFTVAGTATEGTDYGALPMSVTIPAQESTATFQVTPAADGLEEGDETVEVTLVEPPGCQGGPAYQVGLEKMATVYITDMDLTVDIDADVDRDGSVEDAEDEAGEASVGIIAIADREVRSPARFRLRLRRSCSPSEKTSDCFANVYFWGANSTDKNRRGHTLR